MWLRIGLIAGGLVLGAAAATTAVYAQFARTFRPMGK